jgi:hypothetical protein
MWRDLHHGQACVNFAADPDDDDDEEETDEGSEWDISDDDDDRRDGSEDYVFFAKEFICRY